MRMQHQRPAPSVQSGDHARAGSQMAWTFQEQEQRIAHGLEEHIGQDFEIPRPQRPELGRQGKDHMKVITGEDLLFLRVEPLLDLEMGALRAGAMPARVVPDFLDVALRTPLGMTSQRSGATAQKGTCRFPLVKRQGVGLQVLRETRIENGL